MPEQWVSRRQFRPSMVRVTQDEASAGAWGAFLDEAIRTLIVIIALHLRLRARDAVQPRCQPELLHQVAWFVDRDGGERQLRDAGRRDASDPARR